MLAFILEFILYFMLMMDGASLLLYSLYKGFITLVMDIYSF